MMTDQLRSLAEPVPGNAPGPWAETELWRDLRERLRASEDQRQAGRAELRRQGRELALARRLLAGLLGAPRPVDAGVAPASTAPVEVPAARLLVPGFTADGIVFSVDQLERGPTHTVVAGWAFHPAWDAREVDTFLLFTAAGGATFAAPAVREHRPDVAAHFAGGEFPEGTPADGERHLEAAGFRTVVRNVSLPAGVPLDVTLHLEHRGAARRRFTERSVTV